jgi:hypothetical protein
MTVRDVPAEALWSVSVYNAEGYFEPGPSGITNDALASWVAPEIVPA